MTDEQKDKDHIGLTAEEFLEMVFEHIHFCPYCGLLPATHAVLMMSGEWIIICPDC